jgi:hypothetical protein
MLLKKIYEDSYNFYDDIKKSGNIFLILLLVMKINYFSLNGLE